MRKLDVLNPEPLYIQLKKDLQREILQRKLSPGDKLWSEKELEERCGVSRITVRKALAELCKEGWIYKRGGMGSYVAERKQDKAFVDQGVKNIAFIICNQASIDAFCSRVLHGAERAAYKNGFHLIYHSIVTGERTGDLQSKIDILAKENNAIGLMMTGFMPANVVTAANRSPLPCVLVGDIAQKRITTRKINTLAFDNRGSAFDGVNYLISLGHRSIVYLSGPLKYSWWIQKFDGYKDALKQAGISLDKSLFVQCGSDTVEEGHRAINEMLSYKLVFTAIMATNDMLAVGAIKAVKERGLKVPGDISVVGIGDYDIGKHYEPALTTLGYEVERLGEKGVEVLVQPGVMPRRTVLPHQLVVRKSCQTVGK